MHIPKCCATSRPRAVTRQRQFARVVKGVDLRSTAGNCAWVRTPQLTCFTSDFAIETLAHCRSCCVVFYWKGQSSSSRSLSSGEYNAALDEFQHHGPHDRWQTDRTKHVDISLKCSVMLKNQPTLAEFAAYGQRNFVHQACCIQLLHATAALRCSQHLRL